MSWHIGTFLCYQLQWPVHWKGHVYYLMQTARLFLGKEHWAGCGRLETGSINRQEKGFQKLSLKIECYPKVTSGSWVRSDVPTLLTWDITWRFLLTPFQELKFGVEKVIPRCIFSGECTVKNIGYAFSVSCKQFTSLLWGGMGRHPRGNGMIFICPTFYYCLSVQTR